MATKKKMLQAAAGQAGGAGLDITEVFSTYLYEGNGSTNTITNGIDLAGEGGLVWSKGRSDYGHFWTDTERGATKTIFSDENTAESTLSTALTSFNSNGFTLGSLTQINNNNSAFASWTFRKAPKFFDVVTYTGTGPGSATNEQQVSHNLEAKPGIVIIKSTVSGDWWVFTDVIDGSNDYGYLNQTSAFGNSGNNVATDSVFNVGGALNTSGETYVAYLFANNDGDGEFGPDGDQDIIKCGSYTGNGTSGVSVDLGFEPQWLLIKRATGGTSDWSMFDSMRGLTSNGLDARLAAQQTSAEYDQGEYFSPTATGFYTDVANDNINQPGDTYIYMAIRRGPLAQPESGTEVFDIDTRNSTEPGFRSSSGIVDFALRKSSTSTSDWQNMARLIQGKFLKPNTTDAEAANSEAMFDYMNGYKATVGTNSTLYSWMWKRAPGFFDVVAYTGDGVAGRTVSHNLGVAPEMIWAKQRSSSGNSWRVWYEGVPSGKMLRLNGSDGVFNETSRISDADATTFTLNDGTSGINGSGSTYIAYLFATLPGVSKVGSYTGNGSSQTIDCGFTSGARFVLIKKTSNTGHWIVFDTVRGIVSGIDPFLKLNNTDAENTGHDAIDPNSSGFIINESGGAFNVNNETYIFYAIA